MPETSRKSSRPVGGVRFDNAGRVVLVTGGGKGIGRAICDAFARSGAAGVVCLDVDAACASDLPPGVVFRRGDVASEDDCRSAVDWAVQQFGGIDVLVNNATIQPADSYRPLDQFSSDLWRKMLDINFTGYAMMAKHALPHMLRQRSGVIVNIASAQGHRTCRNVPAYGPIKSGNLMQARQWGVEYARQGVRVVSVSPGAIDTPLLQASLGGQGGASDLADRHPLGRIGAPEEVANAVLWLSCADASFVTATDLEVDGGLGAWAAFAGPYELA